MYGEGSSSIVQNKVKVFEYYQRSDSHGKAKSTLKHVLNVSKKEMDVMLI